MVWRFLKHYGTNKARRVLDDFGAAVAAFDPQTASKAQIAMIEAELGKLQSRLAEAEDEVQRQHRETRALKQNYEQHLEAAWVLQAKLSACSDPAAAAQIEASLAKLLDKLELMTPEVEREEREDRDVAQWRADLRLAYEALAGKIDRARAEANSSQIPLQVAGHQQDRTRALDHGTAEASELTSAIVSLSVALDGMNQETRKIRAEIEALTVKLGLLHGDRLDGDPQIAAALAEARGRATLDRASLTERLAALGRPGEAPKLQSVA